MGVLNFSTENLITGVNIIDGNLYWTDNNSEPKKLEIDRFRDYNHDNNQTIIGLNNVIESDISVIRLHPFKALDMELEEYVQATTADQPEPPFEQIFPRFSYRWRYEDGQYSPYAPFTQAAFIPAARSLTSTGTRGEDDFEPDTNEANYIEGFNTTMYNNVGRIILNNIPRGPRDVVAIDLLYTESISSTIYVLETIDIPEGQRGLDYVISPSYTGGVPVEPIYDTDGILTNGSSVSYDLLPLRYELSARKIYSALPANQLTRPYDEVPQRALAQEITANRLIYANYKTGFDQPLPLSIESRFVDNTESETELDGDGLHVKGNRTYEIGVAYIDPYGRQGAMTQVGTITNDDGTVVRQVPLTSAFHQATREQIECTITSDPPPWADRYRYFIKDVSMDHHNLISYNIYNEGTITETSSPFVWIELQSTDRNKVQEGTVLVPRRTNEQVLTEKTRHLIQEIENEAPEVVRAQLAQGEGNAEGRVVGSIQHPSANLVNGFNNDRNNDGVPSNGVSTWYLRDERIDFSESGVLQILNRYIGDQGLEIDQGGTAASAFDVDRQGSGTRAPQDVDFTDTDNPVSSRLYVRLIQQGSDRPMTNWMAIDDIRFAPSENNGHRTVLRFNVSENVTISGTAGTPDDADDGINTITGVTGWQTLSPFVANVRNRNGIYETGSGGSDWRVEFATSELSEEALERLQGRFWVRAARNGLGTSRSVFGNGGELVSLNQIWFETEPDVAESQLDLFWESSETFCVCTEHGYPNRLNWFNCVAEVQNGVYLETTRVFNKFNSVQLVKGVRVNVPTGRNEVIERPNTLTWSGIYNSRTDINRLNEFITADGIQKTD